MSSFDIELVELKDLIITNAAIENKTNLTILEKGHFAHSLKYIFKAAISISAKKIKVTFNCDIETHDNKKNNIEISGLFEIAYTFTVQNLEDLVTGSIEDLQINDELLLSLTNITYSTSRGIIYTRCQGTILKHLLLPIMSTKKLNELISKN